MRIRLKQILALPAVTKDGVTVAKEITLKDPFETSRGANGEAKSPLKTADVAGDGARHRDGR